MYLERSLGLNPKYDYRLVPLAVVIWLVEWIITEDGLEFYWKLGLLVMVIAIFLGLSIIVNILEDISGLGSQTSLSIKWNKMILQLRLQPGQIMSLIAVWSGVFGLCIASAFYSTSLIDYAHHHADYSFIHRKSYTWVAELRSDEFLTKRPGERAMRMQVHYLVAPSSQQNESVAGQFTQLTHKNMEKISLSEAYPALVSIPQGIIIPSRGSGVIFSGEARILSDHITLWITVTSSFSVIKNPPWYAQLAEWCRAQFHQALSGLDPTGQAIIPALVIGDARMISSEMKHQFLAAGILHAMVFSGANFAMILLIFQIIFQRMIPLRWLRGLLNVGLISLIVIIVGTSPAILRAAIMSALSSIIPLGKRMRAQANIIAFTSIILIILWPQNTHDLGLVLSILAVCAIIFFSTPCENWIKSRLSWGISVMKKYQFSNHIPEKLWRKYPLKNPSPSPSFWHRKKILRFVCRGLGDYIICSISIAVVCTLATSLIVFSLHGNMGVGTVITNIIAEPLLLLITIIGQSVLLLSFISLPLAQLLAILLGYCSRLLERIVLISAYLQTDSSLVIILNFPLVALCAIIFLARKWGRIFSVGLDR